MQSVETIIRIVHFTVGFAIFGDATNVTHKIIKR